MRTLFILTFCLFLASCSKTPAIEAIQGIIKEVESAAEDKSTRSIMKHIHENFLGNGHVDKTELRTLLRLHFFRHKNINVVVTNMDIQHDPALPYYASMKGTLLVTGGQNLLPKDGKIISLNGRWELHDNDWYLVEITWK